MLHRAFGVGSDRGKLPLDSVRSQNHSPMGKGCMRQPWPYGIAENQGSQMPHATQMLTYLAAPALSSTQQAPWG